MFYSKSTCGFYDVAIHGDAIPSDAVEITGELYAQLIAGQSAGLSIQWNDSTSLPVLVSSPPSVPFSITPRQGLIMLSRAGLLATVNAAIDAMSGQAGEEARIDFDRANEWRRDWPLLNALAGGLGLTEEQIDQLFITAATL